MKPDRCPHCLHYDIETTGGRSSLWWCECMNENCKATGPWGATEEEAIEKWNLRPTKAQAEKLKMEHAK